MREKENKLCLGSTVLITIRKTCLVMTEEIGLSAFTLKIMQKCKLDFSQIQ